MRSWIVLVLFLIAKATIVSKHRDSVEWWEVDRKDDRNNPNAVNETLFLRRAELDSRQVHSCYEYRIFTDENTLQQANTFCYPSVIVTGYRKCSTSALYVLLSQYPQTRPAGEAKENCPYVGGRTLVQFFDSLPRNVEVDEVILDGCIDLGDNLAIRKVLREPNSFYLVSLFRALMCLCNCITILMILYFSSHTLPIVPHLTIFPSSPPG